MARDPNRSQNFIKYFSIAIISLIAIGIAAYFGIQKLELDKKNENSLIYIDKNHILISDILSDPDNCSATFRNKSLVKSNIEQIEKKAQKVFRINSVLENSNVKIQSMFLDNSTADIAGNFTYFTINYLDQITNHVFTKKIKLYTEVDKIDQLTYCQAVSATFEKQTGSNTILRVKHSRSKGTLAKFNETKISIAAASCPEGYQLTGCTGSVTECPFENLSPFKIDVQPLNPNTCEVWAKATEKCDTMALATAICSKLITQPN